MMFAASTDTGRIKATSYKEHERTYSRLGRVEHDPTEVWRRTCITSDMFNYFFKPPMERKLQLFHKYGFKYVHWCDNWNDESFYSESDIELFCRLLRNGGLKCVDVHGTATDKIRIDAIDETFRSRYIQLLENRIRFCMAAGGDCLVIHPPSGNAGTAELRESLNRSLGVFEEIRPLCEDLGVALAIENCSKAAEEQLAFYFERFPSSFVGFCFDSGHSNLDRDFDQLKKFGNRLKALHLHDNRGSTDDHQPPFWGTVDWGGIVEWIKETGYSKPINFEITHSPRLFEGTMEEYLRFSVEAINRLLRLF